MKRLIPASVVVALVLVLAGTAAAQYNERIDGQVFDFNGKPYPDVTVQMKNIETGQIFTVKTGKDGKFLQIGLKSGIYQITCTNEKDKFTLTETFAVKEPMPGAEIGHENIYVLNLKERAAETAAAHPEEQKKREDEESRFKSMKAHFEAGVAAMSDADVLQKQIREAAADQKAPLRDKRVADCQTAVTEFQQAEQGVGPKEAGNHATVLGNLAAAFECADRHDEAAGAFQKALELKPTAPSYAGLSTNLAYAATAQNDPKALEAKLVDASAACDKAIAIDPSAGAGCWKNLGIVLSNTNHLKEAIAPLEKATAANPKDAQSWFLLGGALTSTIDAKKEGDKDIFIIPPGTAEAYQKCIEVAPDGPYAPQAKAALDELVLMGGGVETVISKKKKH
jgi:tetratricopeptide (TPR) repeat protein